MAESGSLDMGTFLCLGFGRNLSGLQNVLKYWLAPVNLIRVLNGTRLSNIFEMTWGNVVDYSDDYGCINLSERGKHLHMLIKLPFDADK